MKKAMLVFVVILFMEGSTPSFGAEVSVVVDATCDDGSASSTVIVTHSPVTLSCCVERCIIWTGYWYRRTDNGTDQYISTGPTLSVNITETEEIFVCEMLSFDDPACYDDPSGQGNVTLMTSSGTNVSVVVNTSCNSGSSPSQDTYTVTHLPVTMTCCVNGSCPNWTIHWYRESDGNANKSISVDSSISVNLTKTQETFICVVSLNPQADNLFCHDDQHYQDSIKLIKCLLPQVSPVNHTSDIVSDNSHIIVYFKVDTEEYIVSSPNVTFNDSTAVPRWRMKYYAMTNDGGIGKEIWYISKIFHFFVALETKHQFSYEYDNGRYVIQVENKCGSSRSYIDIKGDCDDAIPVMFIEKPQTKLFTLVGQDVLLRLKYKGIRITTYWRVNDTHHLSDIPYIHNIVYHFKNSSVCEEIYSLKLLQVTHSYSGNFTAYGCRGDFTDSAPHLTVNLRVCNKPEFYTTQSLIRKNATTAILRFTFTVCYDPNDELVKLHWLKNNRSVSDVRYNSGHSQVDKSLYVFTLIIHNITVNDTGNYTCKLWYNKAMINASTLKEGTLYLNISSETADSKSVHDATWLLIAGLVGGCIALLLAVLVVTGRKLYSKIRGNDYINLNTATFADNNSNAYVVGNCDDSDEDVEPIREPNADQPNDNANEGSGAGINGDINQSSDVSNESSRSSSHLGEVENTANSHDLRDDARSRCLVQ